MFSLENAGLWHPSMGPLIKSTCFLIIPYLLGFVIASYEALSVYITTGCLTSSASSEKLESQTEKDDSKPAGPVNLTPAHKRRLILALLFFAVLFVLQWANLSWNVARINEILLAYMGALIYTGLVFVVGRAILSLSTMFLTKSNVPLMNPLVIFLTGGIIYFALLATLGLYGSNSSIEPSVWLVTFSIVHFASGWGWKTGTQWGFIWLFWVLHTMQISMHGYNFTHLSAKNQSQDGEYIWPRLTFQGIYVAFIPAALNSFGSGFLIARMLRFDFKNYLNRSGLTLTYLDESNEVQPHGVLIKVGSDLFAIGFPKPYFTVAITAWILIRIVTISLCLFIGFPAKSPYDACFYAALVEFPTMMVVIFSWGAVRGETKLLRNYQENWTLKSESKSKTAQLVDVTTTANDEKF